ncbi:uncharacterized protein N7518_002183 [Penicillium psychrosexuale]|uniref:uncharacterized protein n=1 Tax=Penicillium psychrosexuale TaxID=1002107 RepID=UPI0025455979|nr:uncharacterized protein N7518_002183 [Penicillium psychrosexuale]KAJ5800115.1 hypothetical protein N7518_002183 [Penicillium psychrosexuale]
MAASCSETSPLGFAEEVFSTKNYDHFEECNLRNENLFPIDKFNMLRSRTPAALRTYKLIEPALLLISRMILDRPSTLAIFARRRDIGAQDVFVDTDAELPLPNEEIINLVRKHIPNIELDPDMSKNSSLYGETTLRRESSSDMVTLDYSLVQLLKSQSTTQSQKMAGLLLLATVLGHEMAHILEFRCIRACKFRADDEPFDTPPGITCREAGTAWEVRSFGGRIYPVCQPDGSLYNIRGLCLKSASWNFDVMKMNEEWILKLFTEAHWKQEQPLKVPIDAFARYAFLEDDLLEDQVNASIKRKTMLDDVRAETGSPRKRRFRRSLGLTNICGGKKAQPRLDS